MSWGIFSGVDAEIYKVVQLICHLTSGSWHFSRVLRTSKVLFVEAWTCNRLRSLIKSRCLLCVVWAQIRVVVIPLFHRRIWSHCVEIILNELLLLSLHQSNIEIFYKLFAFISRVFDIFTLSSTQNCGTILNFRGCVTHLRMLYWCSIWIKAYHSCSCRSSGSVSLFKEDLLAILDKILSLS
jgi:hypothetical protein